MSNIKFTYIRDFECPDRVLTLARKIVMGKLRVSWCLNRVIESSSVDKNEGKVFMRVHCVHILDTFDKKRARLITSGRLASDRDNRWIEIPLYNDGRSHERIMLDEVKSSPVVPKKIRNLVSRHLELIEFDDELEEDDDEGSSERAV